MSRIREMQEELIRMIDDVDRLFGEHGIRYTLLGGSVLGVVRHGGFIPWDDDMDIGIFRKDFGRAESLLAQMKQYLYECSENHIVPDAPVGKFHLVNEKYPIDNSPTIDVFPLDAVPDNPQEWKKLRVLANIHHITVRRRAPKNHGRLVKIIFSVFLAVTPKKLLRLLNRWSLKKMLAYDGQGCHHTGNIYGAYTEREYFPTEIYAETVRMNFEGLSLPVPKEYDRYLSQLYGDYMKLPPEEQRVPKHTTGK